MFCIDIVVNLLLMFVPIPWVYSYRIKNVDYNASEHCIVCHAAFGTTAYINFAN